MLTFSGADGTGRTVSPSNPLPVDIQGASLPVVGGAYRSVVSFTRPADTTAYAAGDVVGSGTSAVHQLTLAGPAGGYVLVQSVGLMIANAAVPSGMGGFRVHFYSAQPGAAADNAAFDLVSGDRAAYLGSVDQPTPQDLGSTLWAQTDYAGRMLKLAAASTTLWCEIETRGAYTPASGTAYELRVATLEAGL